MIKITQRNRNTTGLPDINKFEKASDDYLNSLDINLSLLRGMSIKEILNLFRSKEVYKCSVSIPENVFYILCGKILGDGSIGDIYQSTGTGRINFGQNCNQTDYLLSIYNRFKQMKGINLSQFEKYVAKRKSRMEKMAKFKIKSCKLGGLLGLIFYKIFHDTDKDKYYKKKCLSNFWLAYILINKTCLSYWFLDDGSSFNGYLMCTSSYDRSSLFMICDILKMKFNIDCSPNLSGNKRYIKEHGRSKDSGDLNIRIRSSSYNSFTDILNESIKHIECMRYKILTKSETRVGNIFSDISNDYYSNYDDRVKNYYDLKMDLSTKQLLSALAYLIEIT